MTLREPLALSGNGIKLSAKWAVFMSPNRVEDAVHGDYFTPRVSGNVMVV